MSFFVLTIRKSVILLPLSWLGETDLEQEENFLNISTLVAELLCDPRLQSGAEQSKFGNLSNREVLILTSVHAHLPVRTDSGRGGGESQGNLTGGGKCHLFLARNQSCGAFGQPAFFLAGP